MIDDVLILKKGIIWRDYNYYKRKDNKEKEFNKFLIKRSLDELINAGLSLSAASNI